MHFLSGVSTKTTTENPASEEGSKSDSRVYRVGTDVRRTLNLGTSRTCCYTFTRTDEFSSCSLLMHAAARFFPTSCVIASEEHFDNCTFDCNVMPCTCSVRKNWDDRSHKEVGFVSCSVNDLTPPSKTFLAISHPSPVCEIWVGYVGRGLWKLHRPFSPETRTLDAAIALTTSSPSAAIVRE